MIVKCSDCHASYSVDDSKVMNKKFGFSCPKCGANVIIDNRSTVSDEILSPVIENDIPRDDAFVSDDTSTGAIPSGTRTARGEDVALGVMPNDSEISSILNEVEGQIQSEASGKSRPAATKTDDFLDFDLSSDDEEILRGTDKTQSPAKKPVAPRTDEDESISLDDFDTTTGLDLDAGEQGTSSSSKDMEINFDDLTDSELALHTAPLPAKRAETSTMQSRESTHVSQDDFRPLEEDLVLDDMRMETGRDSGIGQPDLNRDIKSEDILKGGSQEDTDESITIDLDSLDIQLDEETPVAKSGETPPLDDLLMDDLATMSTKKQGAASKAVNDDDQNVTLDLDSLDITLDEVEEFKEGITVDDDDERLTLEDAGITIDQLESERTESIRSDQAGENDEELRLSIDEIDPSLRLEDLEKQNKSSDSLITEINTDELPEIDFDKLESGPDTLMEPSTVAMAGAAGVGLSAAASKKSDYLDIETKENYDRYKEDLEKTGSEPLDTVPKGAINFSIDYSLSHSRIGALLRLLGLFYFALIPHYVTLLIYSVLSQILGFINWVIVLFTGQYIDDFIETQEKTLRYMLSISACQTSAVEEMPVFTGKEDIDHALQFNVIFPSRPSRILAFIRITIIGMYIMLLPHLIILSLLSLGAFFITIAGLISVIIVKRWPNILFDFMVRYFRYVANILAYWLGLVDKYPTFRFE